MIASNLILYIRKGEKKLGLLSGPLGKASEVDV
ncbi:hypothetical protein AusDCA_0789 [Desulfitobacterium sp. AusDCA]